MRRLLPRLIALPLLSLVAASGPAAPSAPAPSASPATAKPAAATAPAKPSATTPAAPPRKATPSPDSQARPPVAEVVSQLQKSYESISALRARFAQTLSGPMGKRSASGGVALKKPGKMRWDYEKPEKKLFVADGTTLWVYEPEDEQAYKQPLSSSQLPAQVSFLFGRGKLQEEFEIAYYDDQPLGEPGDLVLKLVPKVASAQYRHLLFVVQPKTFLVKETILFDQQGGTNDLVFSSIETNPKSGVDDSRFSFTPPPDTKIISPR
ncbi:MAG: outer membrane lipoprotein carrier protein LolA [Myxococcales bacterium]|nr:outer membrane lipoprotein carrier protein LolA [Myxococcales bacterium]